MNCRTASVLKRQSQHINTLMSSCDIYILFTVDYFQKLGHTNTWRNPDALNKSMFLMGSQNKTIDWKEDYGKESWNLNFIADLESFSIKKPFRVVGTWYIILIYCELILIHSSSSWETIHPFQWGELKILKWTLLRSVFFLPIWSTT